MENANNPALPEQKLTLPALQRHFYKALITAVATVIVLNLGTLTGFYYNTSNDIEINTNNISDLKQICKDNAKSIQEITMQVQQNIAPLSVNSTQITNLEKQLDKFESNQKRLEDKVDKIIELQIKK